MAIKQEPINYHVIFRPESEGGYTVMVPALPGCVTYGKDLAEAREMAHDAISAYLVSLRKHGEVIPTDEQSFISNVRILKPRVRQKTYA
ncbi:MAG: type II toxin-antitoxin system HicB family antitoxin [Patescibacteria group bacterium]